MCGRYQFTAAYQNTGIAWIAAAIEREYGPGAWRPGEIRPRDLAPVLLPGADGVPVAALLSWGYPSAGCASAS